MDNLDEILSAVPEGAEDTATSDAAAAEPTTRRRGRPPSTSKSDSAVPVETPETSEIVETPEIQEASEPFETSSFHGGESIVVSKSVRLYRLPSFAAPAEPYTGVLTIKCPDLQNGFVAVSLKLRTAGTCIIRYVHISELSRAVAQ